MDDIRVFWRDQKKIERKAEITSQRHAAGTGLWNLRSDEAKKPEVIRHGVRLARDESEHQADELAGALHAEFRWRAPATETAWHAMRRSVRAGDPGLLMPPVRPDGPPGYWQEGLGACLGQPDQRADHVL